MQYILLIYQNEKQWQGLSEAERDKVMGDYGTFTEAIVKSGQYRAGDELQPTSTATTVRVRNGKAMVTDGPFAETREQLGGFYLIEARNLDEANALAARIPSARDGSIEVRPIQPRT